MAKTATKPRKKALAKPVSARWRRILAKIPGYDCFASAARGDWFDEPAADYRVAFFESLRHVKGPLAKKLIHLEDWERAIVGAIYGWKRADGTRRYRKVFIYVPKKNGKSCISSCFVIDGLTQDGEMTAEIYSAAASKEQAGIIFGFVRGMIRLEPELSQRLTVFGAKGGSQQKSVVFDETMSTFRPLASDEDTADGLMPHIAVVDELHRHKDGKLLDILERGTSARSQPLIIIITTADYDRPSACNSEYEAACRVRDNGGDPSKPGYDPSYLPVIYEAKQDDDWTDPKVWAKANPNLGVSKSIEYMQTACRKAQEDPIAKNEFLRLDLNIRTQNVESLIDLVAWDACPDARIDEQALAGRRCLGALDLSQSNDMTALCWMFPPEADEYGQWRFLWRMWCASEAVKRRAQNRIPYQAWANAGWAEIHEGRSLDYSKIKARVLADAAIFRPVKIAFDPYNASDITRVLLNEHGLPMVEYGQTFKFMSEPTKRLIQLVNAGRVSHGGNPVARWQAGNVVGKWDDKENVQPVKKRSKDKIDGIVAAIMCVGLELLTPVEPEQQSMLSDPELMSALLE